jgi:hypothetical protein
MEGLIRLVERQENSVRALRLKSSCSMTAVKKGRETREGEASIDCIRLTRPKSLIKVHANPEIIRHTNGGFVVTNIEASFDGSYTFFNLLETGNEGEKIYRLEEGRVADRRLAYFQGISKSYGWDATIFGFVEENDLRFSDFLKRAKYDCKVKEDKERIKIELRQNGRSMVWSFLKRWNCALESYIERKKKGIFIQYICSSFKWIDPAQMVAFPQQIRIKTYPNNPKDFNEWFINIKKAHAISLENLEKYDWSVKFKEGQYVSFYNGKGYRIGLEPEKLKKIIDEQAQRVRENLKAKITDGYGPFQWNWRYFLGIMALFTLTLVFFKKSHKKRRARKRIKRKLEHKRLKS